MVQLESWDLYQDWERTLHSFEMRSELVLQPVEPVDEEDEGTGEIVIPVILAEPLQGPMTEYNAQMERLERANPEGFAVERRSRWAASLNAYLKPGKIAAIWETWQGEYIETQTYGVLSKVYKAHGDPSKSNARFGWAIAHTERDEDGLLHAVFDVIHAWDPADYPDHQIDYLSVENDIFDYISAFMPEHVSFDQWNSVATIQSLRRRAHEANFPKRVTIEEETASNASNWKRDECFKTALGLGLVHAPFNEIANQEMTFLQDKNKRVDHPTSGPVQTKDVYDALAATVYYLLGEQIQEYVGKALSRTPSASLEGGVDTFPQMREEAHDALAALGRGKQVPGTSGRTGTLSTPQRGAPQRGRPTRRGYGGKRGWGGR
jgi:hypothetical protein